MYIPMCETQHAPMKENNHYHRTFEHSQNLRLHNPRQFCTRNISLNGNTEWIIIIAALL